MNKHFFDIGANDGNTFDYFLLNHPEYFGYNVWCFEPSPKHFIYLLKKARDVSKKFNVIVCPFGVSGNAGILKLNEMINNNESDSFFSDIGGVPDPSPKYQVAAATFPISFLLNKFTKEDDEVVIKLDCEGSEYDIYEELLNHPDLLKRIKIIYNEWHPNWPEMDSVRRERATKIVERLAEHGKELTDWQF
jgi:FkbM family methyltransferase